jgi:hypothetical protein
LMHQVPLKRWQISTSAHCVLAHKTEFP